MEPMIIQKVIGQGGYTYPSGQGFTLGLTMDPTGAPILASEMNVQLDYY